MLIYNYWCGPASEGEREGGGGRKTSSMNCTHTGMGKGSFFPWAWSFQGGQNFLLVRLVSITKKLLKSMDSLPTGNSCAVLLAHTFRVCSGTEWYFAEMGSETTDGWWLRRVGWARMLHLMFLSHFSSRLGRVNKLVESLAWYLCRKIFSRFLLSV